MSRFYEMSIGHLQIPSPAYTALWKVGLRACGEIDNLKDETLLLVPGIGKKYLRGIRDATNDLREWWQDGSWEIALQESRAHIKQLEDDFPKWLAENGGG